MGDHSMTEETKMLYYNDEDVTQLTEKQYADVMESIQSSCRSISFAARSRRTSGIFGVDNCVLLSDVQKCNVAGEGLEALEQDFQSMTLDCNSIISDYEVSLEDMDLVLKRIKKQRQRLERNIVPILLDPRKKNEFSNAFVHFHSMAMKELAVAEQRLIFSSGKFTARLKEIAKINKELEESGYDVQAIDVKEMRIRVEDSLGGMQEIRARCHWCKIVTARIIQTLNRSKLALEHASKNASDMEKKHRMITAQNDDNCENIAAMNQEIAEEQYIKHIRKQGLKTYKDPLSMADLINIYSERLTIDRREKVEQKNLQIAKRTFERHRRLWAQVKRTT